MARCDHCHERKGKRRCPALGAICGLCCGRHRLREIPCPPHCEHLPAPGRPTHEALLSVSHKLLDFEAELPEWREKARSALLGAEARLQEWEAQSCGGYTVLGFTDEHGERLIDLFLRRAGDRLTRDEQAAIERLRQARYSVFEVTKVQIDVGLDLLDLVTTWSGFAHDKEASTRLDVGDCVAAWVVELDDHFELPLRPTRVPNAHRSGVLDSFRAALDTRTALRDLIPGLHATLRRAFGDSPPSPPSEEHLQAAVAARLDSKIVTPTAAAGLLDLPGPERAKAAGGVHEVPLLPHELMRGCLPRIEGVLGAAVRRLRSEPDWGTLRTYTLRQLGAVPEVRDYVEAFAAHSRASGYSKAVTARDAAIVLNHIFYMVNFEAHRRKTFWVDESLAYMLRETRLDVPGRALRPPFACSAFVFTDRPTLELCARAVSLIDGLQGLRGEDLSFLAVYVVQIELEGDAIGLGVLFLFDARRGEWPQLISRPLYVRPDDQLETVLAGRYPGVSAEMEPAFLATPEMKELLHLALNSILYATTAHLDATVLESPTKRRKSGSAPASPAREPSKAYSEDDVYYLPGKIPISRVRQIRKLEDSGDGGQILRRFMVRGHWRRALADWKDQSLRWIEPYWKGPDLAMIIEREYRMKP